MDVKFGYAGSLNVNPCERKDIEKRVEDALSRMTIEEIARLIEEIDADLPALPKT